MVTIRIGVFGMRPASRALAAARARLASATVAESLNWRTIVVRDTVRPQVGSTANESRSSAWLSPVGRCSETGESPGPLKPLGPTRIVAVAAGAAPAAGEETAISRSSGIATVKAPPTGTSPESKIVSAPWIRRVPDAALVITMLWPTTTSMVAGSKPASVSDTANGVGTGGVSGSTAASARGSVASEPTSTASALIAAAARPRRPLVPISGIGLRHRLAAHP
ncbi:MAG: hypothetical protein R2702_10295 [Acidimicrobiales bacterium]